MSGEGGGSGAGDEGRLEKKTESRGPVLNGDEGSCKLRGGRWICSFAFCLPPDVVRVGDALGGLIGDGDELEVDRATVARPLPLERSGCRCGDGDGRESSESLRKAELGADEAGGSTARVLVEGRSRAAVTQDEDGP